MTQMEINVSQCNVQERCDIAAQLVRNGYRVSLAVRTVGGKKKTFLVIDQLQEERTDAKV